MNGLVMMGILLHAVSSSPSLELHMDNMQDCSFIKPVEIQRNETVRVYSKTKDVEMSRQGSCSINFKAVDTIQREDPKLRVTFKTFNVRDCTVSLRLTSTRSLLQEEYTCGDEPVTYVTMDRNLYVSLYKENIDATNYEFIISVQQDNIQPFPTTPTPPDYVVIGTGFFVGIICLLVIAGLIWMSVRNHYSKTGIPNDDDICSRLWCRRKIYRCCKLGRRDSCDESDPTVEVPLNPD